MKARIWLMALVGVAVTQTDVHGITPPSESDGPVRLLGCVVDERGILQADVDNRTEDDMDCNIRCNYELGERTFSHTFNVMVRERFQGRIGRFDTDNGKAGRYSGDLGTCKKVSR